MLPAVVEPRGIEKISKQGGPRMLSAWGTCLLSLKIALQERRMPPHRVLHPKLAPPVAIRSNRARCFSRSPAAKSPPIFQWPSLYAQHLGHTAALKFVQETSVVSCRSPWTQSAPNKRIDSSRQQDKPTAYAKSLPPLLSKVGVEGTPQLRHKCVPLLLKASIILESPTQKIKRDRRILNRGQLCQALGNPWQLQPS